MKKVEYIKCPRCELNYIQKKDKFCEVCKQEMKAGAIDEYELDELEEGFELCPICKVNYLNDGETICAYCQEEKQAFDKDDSQDDWRSYVDKSGESSEDDDMDLLPVENEEIDEELDSAFSQDLDDDFADNFDEDDEESEYSDDYDDFGDGGDADDFEDDDDEEDEDDSDDDYDF